MMRFAVGISAIPATTNRTHRIYPAALPEPLHPRVECGSGKTNVVDVPPGRS